MHTRELRRRFPCLAIGFALGAVALAPTGARADQTLTFDGKVVAGGLDHEFISFDVPAGTKEIQVDHDDQSADDILDWGLDDPSGFRGWGGGNTEPAIVGELAASRSYLTGPLAAGTWKVVVGKAKIVSPEVNYHVVVTLRDVATLAPDPGRSPYVAASPLSTEARWYAGDLHAHSRESGDAAPTIDDLVTFARSQGLDFVELSDHNTVSQLDFITGVQSSHPDILVLPGVEFTTYAGHANGIGATKWVDHKIGQPGVDILGAIDAFHAEGALFSINHPLYDLGNLCIGCSWKHEVPAERVDAVEIATAGTGDLFGAATLKFWDDLCATGRHVAVVGGSDDHSAGEDLGSFGTPVGTPTTYVFANELSAKGIHDGIAHARTVVKFHGPSDPMAEITSTLPLDGDTVHAERATLRATITGGDGALVRWVVDGVAEDPIDVVGPTFDLTKDIAATADKPTRVRIEVLVAGLVSTVTSHVWVAFEAGVGVEAVGEREIAGGGACSLHVGDDPSVVPAAAFALAALAARRRQRSASRGRA